VTAAPTKLDRRYDPSEARVEDNHLARGRLADLLAHSGDSRRLVDITSERGDDMQQPM